MSRCSPQKRRSFVRELTSTRQTCSGLSSEAEETASFSASSPEMSFGKRTSTSTFMAARPQDSRAFLPCFRRRPWMRKRSPPPSSRRPASVPPLPPPHCQSNKAAAISDLDYRDARRLPPGCVKQLRHTRLVPRRKIGLDLRLRAPLHRTSIAGKR